MKRRHLKQELKEIKDVTKRLSFSNIHTDNLDYRKSFTVTVSHLKNGKISKSYGVQCRRWVKLISIIHYRTQTHFSVTLSTPNQNTPPPPSGTKYFQQLFQPWIFIIISMKNTLGGGKTKVCTLYTPM